MRSSIRARRLHAHLWRVARIALGAFASAAQLATLDMGVARAQTFQDSFPKLFYGADDRVSGNLQWMARFNAMSSPFWSQEGAYSARLDSLRLVNPNIRRLAYINAAGRSLPSFYPGHVADRLAAAISDQWIVRNEFGQIVYFDPNIPAMPLLNLSDKCPRVNGKTWGEFIADFAVSDILSSNHWEGIMWDNIWRNVSWVNATIPGSLDLNRDGLADNPDSADAWWTRGLSLMLDRFDNQVGPQVPIIGNGNSTQYPYLNGRYFEDFPYRETWSGSMTQIADWQRFSRPPSFIILMTRSRDDDFQHVRYGLCSALIAGTHHVHADEHFLPHPVLYDEYLVNLGQPTGPPVELGLQIVGEADFESGLPGNFQTGCGPGQATWTTNPALVIDGQASLLGTTGSDQATWYVFYCSDPADIHLLPGATYTVTFNYRIVSEPPGDGYFYVSARSDTDINGSNRGVVIIDPPVGTVGQARGEVTLGSYPNYYLLWGMRNGGAIVIDSIRIVTGRGGVFRRNFEGGMALVNPSTTAMTLSIEPGYHRIAGNLDRLTNNGSPVSLVTLQPEDGLVLLGGPTGIPPGGDPSPPLETIFAFPNPIRIVDSPAVQIAGVPADGSVAIISPSGRALANLCGPDPDGLWRWDMRTASSGRVASGLYLALVRGADRQVLRAVRLAIFR